MIASHEVTSIFARLSSEPRLRPAQWLESVVPSELRPLIGGKGRDPGAPSLPRSDRPPPCRCSYFAPCCFYSCQMPNCGLRPVEEVHRQSCIPAGSTFCKELHQQLCLFALLPQHGDCWFPSLRQSIHGKSKHQSSLPSGIPSRYQDQGANTLFISLRSSLFAPASSFPASRS